MLTPKCSHFLAKIPPHASKHLTMLCGQSSIAITQNEPHVLAKEPPHVLRTSEDIPLTIFDYASTEMVA
jgi:hypothetical protein